MPSILDDKLITIAVTIAVPIFAPYTKQAAESIEIIPAEAAVPESVITIAIVARELGIPAVAGCGNATLRLRTGDRVMVDGGQGIVHILSV